MRGVAVEFVAVLEQAFDGLLLVLGIEEGSILVLASAPDDFPGRNHQPDYKSQAMQDFAVFGAQDNTSARGDDATGGLGPFEVTQNG